MRPLKSPQKTFYFLDKRPLEVKKQELKHLSYFIAAAENHKYYNELLKLYVPDWNVKITKTQFIGEGQGAGALSAFRKVTFENQDYFEKVFFTQSKDLQTIKWFDEFVREQIKDKIKTPKIRKIYSGELLTIVYMDFFELKPFKEQKVEKKLIEFTKSLYNTSVESLLNDKQNIPDHLLDYKTSYQYQSNIGLLKDIFKREGIDFDLLEKSIQSSKKVITQGDIIPRNVAKKNIVIDWDSFGIYPIGMEQAYLYYFTYLEKDKKPFINPKDWLNKHYGDFIEDKDLEQFNLNFTFFVFVYSYRLFIANKYPQIKDILLKELSLS
ncbi:hypothetical protein OBJ96_03210 [Empedobacter falsenii]